MRKTLSANGKKYTARQITKLPRQETNGGDYIVTLNGEKFYFNFRQIQDDHFAPVCDEHEANAIALMRDDGSFSWSIWMPFNQGAGRPPMYDEKMTQAALWLPQDMLAWLKDQPGTMSETMRGLIKAAMSK